MAATTEHKLATLASKVPTAEKPLYTGDGPLSPGQASLALKEFRDIVIRNEMPNWEPHRSILRDGMIEAFVSQRLSDPRDWFAKVAHLQRSETNPLEKKLFLERICEIVERIEADKPVAKSAPPALSAQSPPARPASETSGRRILPAAPPPAPAARRLAGDAYVVANIAQLQVTPHPDQFYHLDYKPTIARMVAYIIQVEGPIYYDVLLARIARVHGFQKAGGTIQKLVRATFDHRFPRTVEDSREVFWAPGSQTGSPVPFRNSESNIRSHADIPIAELASLALRFLRMRNDDEWIVRRMTAHFELSRLRESTRRRFERAISLARAAPA
jgi:hypothetical protein